MLIWLGGAFDDYSQIGEWRDTETTKPTEQECLDEWDVYLAEKAVEDAFEAAKAQTETDAVTNFAALPDWVKTWTANDAAGYVHDNVLNGLDAAGVDAYVDNLFVDVNSLATAVPAVKAGLKQIGGQLVVIRDLLMIIAKLLMQIRDLVIRFRQ